MLVFDAVRQVKISPLADLGLQNMCGGRISATVQKRKTESCRLRRENYPCSAPARFGSRNVRLPQAQVLGTRLDSPKTQVYSRQTGVARADRSKPGDSGSDSSPSILAAPPSLRARPFASSFYPCRRMQRGPQIRNSLPLAPPSPYPRKRSLATTPRFTVRPARAPPQAEPPADSSYPEMRPPWRRFGLG